MPKRLNIVTIGGGSGHFILLSALKNIENINITAIVAMADSGGSSGKLRDKLGVLPPGDILKCLIALSQRDDARKLLQSRFDDQDGEGLDGHTLGNILISQSANLEDFPKAVNGIGRILEVKGQIYPVTVERCTLIARLKDGNYLFGEKAIDIPHGRGRPNIQEAILVPQHNHCVPAYPPVLEAIKNADFIILGPGDLYTSIMPNLLVDDVADSIKNSPAKLLYLVNIMTKYGETHGYEALDFARPLQDKISRAFDKIIVNNREPKKELQDKYYKEELARWVRAPLQSITNCWPYCTADLLDEEEVIRHNPEKLRKLFEEDLFKYL